MYSSVPLGSIIFNQDGISTHLHQGIMMLSSVTNLEGLNLTGSFKGVILISSGLISVGTYKSSPDETSVPRVGNWTSLTFKNFNMCILNKI